ncbi:IncF plasmid conjugative transfer pilus assembly protein TraF [Candidatus Burkholderia pumila]|uniref:IncF plasmid conjugative transfer pilus assembly protein TraF n=1 Tax=Candidatus Burkholderia pumila TaxID=1090375 RepID=A0ABR5HPK4_9BURK|nr:IncF plasmid conjugative transfer pilus assembly protein TraF [Candidatus Burkholderia pumila]
MAPAVKMLANRYVIDVLGVSVDARGIDEFPHPADDRAQAAAWGVERVPALFTGSKETGDHAAIGFGTMSLSEIVNRIFVLTGTNIRSELLAGVPMNDLSGLFPIASVGSRHLPSP